MLIRFNLHAILLTFVGISNLDLLILVVSSSGVDFSLEFLFFRSEFLLKIVVACFFLFFLSPVFIPYLEKPVEGLK